MVNLKLPIIIVWGCDQGFIAKRTIIEETDPYGCN